MYPAINPQAREFIAGIVATHHTTVFVTRGCADCLAVVARLQAEGWPGVAAINLDTHSPLVSETLRAMTGQHAVPSVWVRGAFVGGRDEILRLVEERRNKKKQHRCQ